MKKLTTTKSLRTPIGFILSTVLLTLMIGVLASSCALDQGAGHTFSLRMPVFSTQDRSTSRAKATINESMIPYTVPPVVGWEDLLTESDTIDFSYLDKEVSCTYTINGGEVFFEGSS